jgi:hypothetical protein
LERECCRSSENKFKPFLLDMAWFVGGCLSLEMPVMRQVLLELRGYVAGTKGFEGMTQTWDLIQEQLNTPSF